MFFAFSQPRHVLNMFLNFGDFQPHVLIKKVLIRKKECIALWVVIALYKTGLDGVFGVKNC